jgi:hypothetical protein
VIVLSAPSATAVSWTIILNHFIKSKAKKMTVQQEQNAVLRTATASRKILGVT